MYSFVLKIIDFWVIRAKIQNKNGAYQNGPKLPKLGPNELKFAPDMYFYWFYHILKDF